LRHQWQNNKAAKQQQKNMLHKTKFK